MKSRRERLALNKIGRLGVLVFVIAAAVVGCSARITLRPDSHDSFCRLAQERFPDLRWTELRRYDRLSANDAILVCGASEVEIVTSRPFGFDLSWTRGPQGFLAKVPASSLVALRPGSGSETVHAQVISVNGLAYYSQDRELIQKYKVGHLRKVAEEQASTRDRLRAQRLTDVQSITWDVATPNRELGPWDMLWTDTSGKVEIEILRDGPLPETLEGLEVKGSGSGPTRRIRLPRGTYLVLKPAHVEHAIIRRVIGDVKVAHDRAEVRAFLAKHGQFVGAFGEWSRDETRKWLEGLTRDDLE